MRINTINIGTKNQIKVDALRETVAGYGFLAKAKVFMRDVPSAVSPQPKTLEETIMGAKQRAKSAFPESDLSFGIEDGLMQVDESLTGYMNVCVCAIYDAENYYLGFSSAFEYPRKIIGLIFREGLDVDQAFYELNFTKNKQIGAAEGAVNVLTRGRWRRSDTIKQSIITALIVLENKELYADNSGN